MLRMGRTMWAGLVGGAAVMGSAGAAITGVTGQAQVVSPPVSATYPAIPFSTASVWHERVNVTAPSGGFVVDMLVNGGFMTSNAPSGGVVTGAVDSHFIHWSPIALLSNTASGTVSFGAPILGVMIGDLWLNQSDAALGSAGTAYPVGTSAVGRGMNTSFSQLSVTGSMLQFSFLQVSGFNPMEQVRILTRAIPAPGGVCVAALGFAAGLRRRR